MGLSEIIDSMSNAVIIGITVAVFALVIVMLIIYAVIPIGTIVVENKEEITDEAKNVADTVKKAAPQALEAAKTYCSLDQTVLDQLRPNTIGSYMLNNVNATERGILEHWKSTGEITACEIKILDENIDNYYKERLNLKSATKSIVGCNLIECLDKYKIIEKIDSEQ